MIYLVESVQTPTTSILYEFIRNEDGTKAINKIDTFKPFFYVKEDCPIDNWDAVLRTVKGFKSIEGVLLKKVFVQKSLIVPMVRKRIEGMGYLTWESDILYNNRYTYGIKDFGKGDLKTCFLDIETDSDEIFPDVEKADQAIVCMTSKIGDTGTTWLCGEKSHPGVRYFLKEEDMLDDFMNWFRKESPDLASSWNSSFDFNYIVNRCNRLGIDYKRLSPLRDVFIKSFKDEHEVRIKGVVILDLLAAYKTYRKYGNLPLLSSYSLDSVGKEVLNKGKVSHEKSIHYLWKNDLKTLIEYNRWDVELLDLLDKKCKIIGFFDELRRLCKVQFNDVYRTTALLDGFLISRLKEKIILPTAKKHENEVFKGAFVSSAKKGLHHNVICQDVRGLYPSLIQNFNLSFETYGGNDIKLPSGQSFSGVPGVIPMFLEELFQERKRYKKLLKKSKTETEKEFWNTRQYGIKIVMNSLYGYLSYPGSRLYKKEVGEAITGMGRYVIKLINKWVEENGNEHIYSDTDGTYFLSKEKDKYQILIEGFKIRDNINKKLKTFAEKITGKCYLEIEFEKIMKTVLFTDARKRYAYRLLWESDTNFDVDKKLHVVGFGQKRSDNSQVSKTIEKKVMELIMAGTPKDVVVSYLRNMHQQFIAGRFSDEDIGFPKGLSKYLHEYNPPGPVVKGSYFSNKWFKTNFNKGNKPKWVWIKGMNGLPDTVETDKKEYRLESIAFSDKIPKEAVIDWNRMNESTFKKKLKNLFTAVGWAWEDLDTISLDGFMGHG